MNIVQAKFHSEEGPGINNLVLMGMGEPLDNYDNVLKAIAIINSDYYWLGESSPRLQT